MRQKHGLYLLAHEDARRARETPLRLFEEHSADLEQIRIVLVDWQADLRDGDLIAVQLLTRR